MSMSDCFSSNESIILPALVAILLSDDLSADDLNVLGNAIVAIGSLMLTKAAQLSSSNSDSDVQQQLDDIKSELQKLNK